MKSEKHPLAGKRVKLNLASGEDNSPNAHPLKNGDIFWIEDWAERLLGESWMNKNGNMACMLYGFRAGISGLPSDNEVVGGKVGAFTHLVHVSELGEVVE